MYDFYSNALEFFVEHGIQLTENQLISLKENSKAHALAVYKMRNYINKNQKRYNKYGIGQALDPDDVDKLEIAIRKVDILNKKLKRGEISQKQYNKEIKSIQNNREKYGMYANMTDKKGSHGIDRYLNGRGKPIKTSINDVNSKSYLTNYPVDNSITAKSKIIDTDANNKNGKELIKKIKRNSIEAYYNYKDNPKESVRRGKQLLKTVGMEDNNPRTDISVMFNKTNNLDNKHRYIEIQPKTASKLYDDTDKYKNKSDMNLIHNSNRKDLKYLSPSGSSKEGLIYGAPKVFAYDSERSESKQFRNNKNNAIQYKLDSRDLKKKANYIGQDSDQALKENIGNKRYDSGSRSIETDKKIRVHKIGE